MAVISENCQVLLLKITKQTIKQTKTKTQLTLHLGFEKKTTKNPYIPNTVQKLSLI